MSLNTFLTMEAQAGLDFSTLEPDNWSMDKMFALTTTTTTAFVRRLVMM